MKWRWAVVIVVTGAAISSSPNEVFADEGVTLIVGARGVLAKRIRDEVQALGIPVREQTRWSPDSAIENDKPIVVVLPKGASQPIEVWQHDAATSQWSRIESIPRIAGDGALDTRAVRTAEVVRALRQHAVPIPMLSSLPQPSPQLSEHSVPKSELLHMPIMTNMSWVLRGPTEPIALPKVHPTRQPGIGITAGLAVPIQYFGPSLSATLGARLQWSNRFGAGILVDLPIVNASMSRPEGSATFQTFNVGFEANGIFLRRRNVLGIGFVGAMFSTVVVSGYAVPPFGDREETLFALIPFVGAELRPRFTQNISLVLGARVGSALPNFDVHFGGQRIGTWGAFIGTVIVGAAFDK